jgi:acetoin utilization deacetylase AcuC-like enzyme
MIVYTHNDFLDTYTADPAAAQGRMEAILDAVRGRVTFDEALPAGYDDIRAVHTEAHIQTVIRKRLYNISVLAAGGVIQAAETGMEEPSFALVRPPGHHASADSSWGFCYFNNVAVAIEYLKRNGLIETAHILDFDLHYGDGTVNILGGKEYVTIHNPGDYDHKAYLREVADRLEQIDADVIGVSAGFDNHVLDWGGLLATEDYQAMGRMLYRHHRERGTGVFAALEGGYNHRVLGENVRSFLEGLEGS